MMLSSGLVAKPILQRGGAGGEALGFQGDGWGQHRAAAWLSFMA
jgi:hypothetical protein